MKTIPRSCFCIILKNEFLKTCNCSTRTRRSDYWIFIITIWVVYAPIFSSFLTSKSDSVGSFYMMMISLCTCIWLTISSTIRRLHDAGKTGCFVWLFFFPPFTLILIFFCFYDSEKESNYWGDSPKYILDRPLYTPSSNDIETYKEPEIVINPNIIFVSQTTVAYQPNPQNVDSPLPYQLNSNSPSNVYYIAQVPPPQVTQY